MSSLEKFLGPGLVGQRAKEKKKGREKRLAGALIESEAEQAKEKKRKARESLLKTTSPGVLNPAITGRRRLTAP